MKALANVPDEAQRPGEGAEKGLGQLLLPGRWAGGGSGSRAQTAASGELLLLALPLLLLFLPVGVSCCMKGAQGPRQLWRLLRQAMQDPCVLCPDPGSHAPTIPVTQATVREGGDGARIGDGGAVPKDGADLEQEGRNQQ